MPQPTPGPIVLNTDVENAVRDMLQAWVPFYLARIDDGLGEDPGTTVPRRTWDVSSAEERWPEETPPALIVISSGIVEDPELHAPGTDQADNPAALAVASYAAVWQVNVGVTVGGTSEDGTRALAGRHAAAVRYALVQQGDLGGLAEATWWRGERYDVLPRSRTIMAAEVLAHVRIARVVDARGAHLPRTRPTDPTDPAAPTPTPTGARVPRDAPVLTTGGHRWPG